MEVYNPKTGTFIKTRAFLDRGSNISVVSTKCAKNCGLSFTGSEKMFISTFGNTAQEKSLKRTNVNFYENTEKLEGKLSVDFFVLDHLVNKVKSYKLSDRQNNCLKDNAYILADPEANKDGFLEIDMLLGQNCVHHFSKGETLFLPGGSVLLPTWNEKYILAGPLDSNNLSENYELFQTPNVIAAHSILNSFDPLDNRKLSNNMKKDINRVYSCISSEEELEIIDTFRNFEMLGISPLDYKISPVQEEFDKTTTFDGERYVVRLPYKKPQIFKLSNNFLQAFQRLMSGVKRRLRPKYAEEREKYEKSFKDELEKGILEKVCTLGTVEEINKKLSQNPQYFNELKLENGKPCCYLPHQAVYKQSTGKFRRVHDGKARPYKSAYSLNDCLEKGPNLMSSILHILLGFRKNEFAAKADIEKAFPQVKINEQDRDVLRCLWIEGDQVCVYRFARLPFGLSCSPYILQATLQKHLGENKVDETTLQNFIASIYVDDSVWSEILLEDLYKRKDFYTKLFLECGMNFRDWTSNHPEAREFFAKLENREASLEELVLGMKWNVLFDNLRINSDKLLEVIQSKLKTKRDLWKIIPSIYDPLGLLSPYVLLGKMIVAEACKEVKGWDSKLPQKYIDKTRHWANEFVNIENVDFNRFAGIKNPKKVQLFGACDASTKALGACVYLVSTAQDGTITSNLLMSKTRNAPSTEHSIPRLELASSVLLCNIMEHVRKVYKVEDDDVFWFTDSADVIFWIYSGHFSWRPFVANQLKKIKRCSKVQNWRHIDTSENPADLASRGSLIKDLHEGEKSDLWHFGPGYWTSGDLNNGKSTLSGYDKHYKDMVMPDHCKVEMKSSLKRQIADVECASVTVASISSIFKNVSVSAAVSKPVEFKLELPSIDKLSEKDLNIDKFEYYDALMEATNLVLQKRNEFKTLLKRGVRRRLQQKSKKSKNSAESSDIAKEDAAREKSVMFSSEAEILWVQATQKKYFSEIFLLLENSNAQVSSSSRSMLVNHGIFLDKDLKVLRCTTRNERSLLPYSTVYPIFLPSMVKNADGEWEMCKFSRLLVKNRHHAIGHQGVPDTLSHIRSEFWILQGRRFVQKIIRKCVVCKKIQGPFYSTPPSDSLPEFRTIRDKPFAGCGVDFVGPFKCRDTPKGKSYKVWYLSFVCGSTRAVHVEACKSRKIDDFLLAISRFMNQYGIPKSFISDHEGSFMRASKELEQIVHSRRVRKYLKSNRISWNFYTEKSPHKGGFLERLNASIKKTFYKVLNKRVLNFEEFRTLACHVGSTINDRPLTYIYSEIASENKALSPSMLLRGYNLSEPPTLDLFKPQCESETKISESYKKLEKVKDAFWRIWEKQYLQSLFERHVRAKKANKELIVPQLGEVCLISEEKLPRREWRMGRVVEIDIKRGAVRQVTVQTLSPGGKFITKLRRTPEKLVPIGVQSELSRKSPETLIPLEVESELVDVDCEKLIPLEGDPRENVVKTKDFIAQKYTKRQLYQMKKACLWPPYSKTKQFLDSSSINTGPDKDFINKERNKKTVRFAENEISDELPRDWGRS